MSEQAVRAHAATRHFGAATLERWLGLAAADRDALLAFATHLRLGENHLRDLLDLAEDIAARRQTTIAAVLPADALQRLLREPGGRNEALKRVKAALRQARYPQLAATEAALAAAVKRLALPGGVRVELPAHLADGTVRVTLRADNADEFRARSRALATAAGSDAVDEIFRLLEGVS